MKEAALRADWLPLPDVARAEERSKEVPEVQACRPVELWSPERFAREQIRRLVRRVFLSGGALPVRQVVFSAADSRTHVEEVCQRVGESLADEKVGDVAVVGGIPAYARGSGQDQSQLTNDADPIRRGPPTDGDVRGRSNLWLLPPNAGGKWGCKASAQTYLEDIRREFRYSIVQGPPAVDGEEALSLAQSTDGLILVLSARHTRRIAALRIREMIVDSDVRLLGTVLSDREFPIPEKIYRRL